MHKYYRRIFPICIGQNSNSSLRLNGDLIITNAKDFHEGDYLCQASNGIGSGKSKLLSIHVDGTVKQSQTRLGWVQFYVLYTFSVPPSFQTSNFASIQTAAIMNGKDRLPVIKCAVIGDKPLHISWVTSTGLQIRPEQQHFKVSIFYGRQDKALENLPSSYEQKAL